MKFLFKFCMLLLFVMNAGSQLAQAQNWKGIGEGRGEFLELDFTEWEGDVLFLEAWMEVDDLKKIQPLVNISGPEKNILIASSWRNSGAAGPMSLRSSQLAIFSSAGWDSGSPDWVSPLALEIGKWFHLAVQITAGACEIWVNGVSIGKLTELESELCLLLREKPLKLTIGAARDRERFLHTFRGGVDELRLWNKRRTLRELRSTLPLRLTAAESGVVLRWSFDDEVSLRGQPSILETSTDTLNRQAFSWDEFHQYAVPGNFPSVNIAHFDFLKPFISKAPAASLALGSGTNSGEFHSVWFSTDHLVPGDWMRMAEADPSSEYSGYLGDTEIGIWDLDGGAIQGPVEALVDHLLEVKKSGFEGSYQLEPRRPGLPEGFVATFPACQLLDGRWAVSGNMGVYWWDGTRFYPLFPKEYQKQLAFWVEIYPGTFLISDEKIWTAFCERDGNLRSWPALEIDRNILDWETDHAGRIWIATEDRIVEVRLEARYADKFWARWSDTDSIHPWISETVSHQSALDLRWDVDRNKLWAVTNDGLIYFNHDQEMTWTQVAQKETRLRGGVKTLVLGENKNFWVGISEGLMFFDARKTDAELYPWPGNFGVMGGGSGRIQIGRVGEEKLWALDGNGNLVYWNQGTWEPIMEALSKGSELRFFSYNENEVWLAGTRVEWIRGFRKGRWANDSDSSNPGLVLFESLEGEVESPESREKGVASGEGVVRSDFPKITAHVFSDRVQIHLNRVEWKVRFTEDNKQSREEQDDICWASKPTMVQAGARNELVWRPDKAGNYKIQALLTDQKGKVLDQQSMMIKVVPEWHELVWGKSLIWSVSSLLMAGLVFVFWKGGSSWVARPRLQRQLSETLNRLNEAQIVAKRELSNSETSRRKLKEKEKDLREIRFELIGRLHEEIRPLLEYILPDENRKKVSDPAVGLDLEFQEKVRESLQFLSDLCLVEIDQHNHEGSSADVEQEWFSLQELLAEMERWFRVSCDHKAIRLKTELTFSGNNLEANNNIQVFGPFGLLRSVLFNLVSNAIHFTQRGEVTIVLRVGNARSLDKASRGQLHVEVIDTGAGIPVEEIRRITEPGYRGVNSREKWRPGKGTGLFIVRKALDFVGADLKLESEVGKGSRFSFTVGIQAPEILDADIPNGAETVTPNSKSSVSSATPPDSEDVALWDELQEAVRYSKWREASLVALALKKKNACSMEELNRLGEIMLRQGKEEALEWIRLQRPIAD